MVHVGDVVWACFCVGDSKVSGAGLPYLCSNRPLFGSGYFIPFHVLGDWLLAFFNTFPAGGKLFPRFPNTVVSVRLTYLYGLYTVLPRSPGRVVDAG